MVTIRKIITTNMAKRTFHSVNTTVNIWTKQAKNNQKPRNILQKLKQQYGENENKLYSEQISKYMRNKFSFYGIKSPERRKIDKEIYIQCNIDSLSQEELYALVALCWNEDKRDFQAFAYELLFKRLDSFLPKNGIYDPMELLKALIVTKSWWDTVDMMASKVLGYLAKHDSEHALPLIDEWISSDNMWLRRSAILYQLSYKKSTDEKKLFRYCLQCCHEKEFFIQKAIGWSLREYAKTNQKAVKKFVKDNEKKLANLSKREALKHIK